MSVRKEFAVHLLNDVGIDKATKLGEIFSTALSAIEELLPPPCRELSIVITKLQEASYFAKRGIAVDTANQKLA